jgi:hypothetical protein
MAAGVGELVPRLKSGIKADETAGGCQDVTLIIDFLAAYLFPEGGRVIDEWIATGISLGGK